jgi:hypothetical protein
MRVNALNLLKLGRFVKRAGFYKMILKWEETNFRGKNGFSNHFLALRKK